MKLSNKKPKVTRAELERKLFEVSSQLIHNYHFAAGQLKNATAEHLTGSGVILQLTTLGGKEIIPPVCIRDGLSVATIAAIKADLTRSFELALNKP